METAEWANLGGGREAPNVEAEAAAEAASQLMEASRVSARKGFTVKLDKLVSLKYQGGYRLHGVLGDGKAHCRTFFLSC
jgi:hypothetical protein